MFLKTPAWLAFILNKRLWKVNTQEKCIFLTFDDGPSEFSFELLDLLEQYQAQATFFCLGKNIVNHPDFSEILKQHGHAIGNHSFNHINGWKQLNSKAYIQDVTKANSLTSSKLFRPPYGKTTFFQRKALRKNGYKIIMWTFNSKDYKQSVNLKKIVNKAKKSSSPGTIFLFHDAKKARHNTVFLLEELLPYWKENGYQLKKIEV